VVNVARHSDGSTAPRIRIALTNPLPDGNDPSLGPAITRALPEKPELRWKP